MVKASIFMIITYAYVRFVVTNCLLQTAKEKRGWKKTRVIG
jgi:hypothetical protein